MQNVRVAAGGVTENKIAFDWDVTSRDCDTKHTCYRMHDNSEIHENTLPCKFAGFLLPNLQSGYHYKCEFENIKGSEKSEVVSIEKHTGNLF